MQASSAEAWLAETSIIRRLPGVDGREPMRQTTKRALFLCVMLLAAASGKLAAQSNFYEGKTIRLIVGFTASIGIQLQGHIRDPSRF
jgi:hypothetical protein